MLTIMIITTIILAVLAIIVFIAIIYYFITSKKDSPLTKLGIIITILLSLISLSLGYIINKNIEKIDDNIASVLFTMADQIEEENFVNLAIEQAEKACNDGDYLSAIEIIKDALDKYPDNKRLKNALKKYEENFINSVIKQAEEAFNDSGYFAAIEIIKDALKKYPDNKKLKDALEKYKPVLLSNYKWLKNTTESDARELTYINEYNSDKYGNTYNTSFALSQGSVSFVTDEKYSKFKGIVAFPEDFKYDSYRDSAKVTVYADDDVYLWSSAEMSIESKPQPFDVDITGTKTITLVWECTGRNIWENWGDYATIFDGAFYK